MSVRKFLSKILIRINVIDIPKLYIEVMFGVYADGQHVCTNRELLQYRKFHSTTKKARKDYNTSQFHWEDVWKVRKGWYRSGLWGAFLCPDTCRIKHFPNSTTFKYCRSFCLLRGNVKIGWLRIDTIGFRYETYLQGYITSQKKGDYCSRICSVSIFIEGPGKALGQFVIWSYCWSTRDVIGLWKYSYMGWLPLRVYFVPYKMSDDVVRILHQMFSRLMDCMMKWSQI